MKIVFADLETYYNDEYSLKKISIPEYVHSPLFEVNGCAVKEGSNGSAYWVEGPDLPLLLKQFDVCAMCSHNWLFDGYILSQRFNYVPKVNICTLSIARATLSYILKSLSLESVARYLDLGVKNKAALTAAKGMRLADLKQHPNIYNNYIAYAKDDVEYCAGIFTELVPSKLPWEELPVIDMVMRCATQPNFSVNIELLRRHLTEVIAKKEHLLARCGADKSELMSNDKLADVLRELGVEPPKKISLTTGKETYAFAKTDVAFLDLLEHENPMVQAVVAARLGVKSTLEETRTQRFIRVGEVALEATKFPVPLGYGNAHTHRLGGEWKLNLQNLTRGGNLRASLEAPPGYKVVKADASQIECRLTGWFSNCTALTQQFANGEDVYASFASRVWQRIIDKRTDPDERFIGKGAVLGLGFGMGWIKFQRTIKIQSENQLGKRISLSDAQSQNIVSIYRQVFHEIPETWDWLRAVIPLLAYGGTPVFRNPVIFEKGRIILPSLEGKIGEGMTLKYHNLRQEDDQWVYDYGKEKKRLFGGKVMENIAQALDRVVVISAAMRLQKRMAPLRLALQAHDENVYVVPEAAVDVVKQILLQEMSRRPAWAPDLPLAAEVASGSNYRDLK